MQEGIIHRISNGILFLLIIPVLSFVISVVPTLSNKRQYSVILAILKGTFNLQ